MEQDIDKYFQEEATHNFNNYILLTKKVSPAFSAGAISDGYHTFDELYEHRIVNFIALCRTCDMLNEVAFGTDYEPRAYVWRSKKHSDDSEWDGWFILGINKELGKQITYHLPISKWEETEFAETLDKAPEFDGHTSADVLERIKQL